MKNRKIVNVLLIISPILVGLASSILTSEMMKKYGEINKPALSPPTILFPVVWTILYLLMGIGAALVYTNDSNNKENKNLGLIFHFIQLVLNFFWSIIFFKAQKYLMAFIWLILLWLSVMSMLQNYKKVSRTAYLLNIPYIVWLTFAGYLNLAVYILN